MIVIPLVSLFLSIMKGKLLLEMLIDSIILVLEYAPVKTFGEKIIVNHIWWFFLMHSVPQFMAITRYVLSRLLNNLPIVLDFAMPCQLCFMICSSTKLTMLYFLYKTVNVTPNIIDTTL